MAPSLWLSLLLPAANLAAAIREKEANLKLYFWVECVGNSFTCLASQLFSWTSGTYTTLYALNVLADCVAFFVIVRQYATWLNLIVCGVFWTVIGIWSINAFTGDYRPLPAIWVCLVEGVLRMTLAMAMSFGAPYSRRRHTLTILILLWVFLGLEDFALVLHPNSSLLWANVNYWLSYVLCIGAFGWISLSRSCHPTTQPEGCLRR